MVLNLFVHTKSGKVTCVRNQEKKSLREKCKLLCCCAVNPSDMHVVLSILRPLGVDTL